jgi:hypothetical protein
MAGIVFALATGQNADRPQGPLDYRLVGFQVENVTFTDAVSGDKFGERRDVSQFLRSKLRNVPSVPEFPAGFSNF